MLPLRRGLIVSCQAEADSPMYGPDAMAAMAQCAALAGAVGVRVRGAADIRAVRAAVDLPILGLTKRRVPGFDVYITPGFEDAAAVASAGADAIALDGTQRPRPGGFGLAALIRRIHDELGTPVVADIATADEAEAALAAGADAVSTTLSGYTPDSPQQDGPDLELVEVIAARLDCPVIAEGRYHTPELAAAAMARGAQAVVVGTAITEPISIARRFVQALPHEPAAAGDARAALRASRPTSPPPAG